MKLPDVLDTATVPSCAPHDALRSPAQRRAVLAERLLVDLGRATTPADAAAVVTQAMTTIGGASYARVERGEPGAGSDTGAVVLASSGEQPRETPLTLADAETGLAITLDDAEVPPIAVTRALRALAAVLDRIDQQTALLTAARTDPLTGLLNRRALDGRLAAEVARQRRGGEPLSLLVVDIDHFKQINDTHGHAHGDRVLKAVADAMREVARTADDLGRIGGDEFALVLAGTGSEGALAAARRLCQRVRQVDHDVSVSVGVASTGGRATASATQLLRAADEALYAAKRGGRDRAVLASEDGRDDGDGQRLAMGA